MSLLPKKFIPGNTIGIIAPSKPIDEDRIKLVENFIEYLNSIGLNVVFGENFYKVDKYKSAGGTPQERASDINSMFANKNIHGIWCLQGGSLANQTLEYIDYDLIKENPKFFFGKSDIDILLVAINALTGLPTFHTCDSKIGAGNEMDYEYNKKRFIKRCFDGSKEIEANDERKVIRNGKAEGKLIGCNMQSLLKISGTRYSPNYSNSILFFETYRADPSSLLHRLTTMKLQGSFDSLQGVVLGSNYGRDSDEFTVSEIINDFFTQEIPIMKTNMFGHYQPHACLPIGSTVRVDTSDKSIKILSNFTQ